MKAHDRKLNYNIFICYKGETALTAVKKAGALFLYVVLYYINKSNNSGAVAFQLVTRSSWA